MTTEEEWTKVRLPNDEWTIRTGRGLLSTFHEELADEAIRDHKLAELAREAAVHFRTSTDGSLSGELMTISGQRDWLARYQALGAGK